MKKTLSILLALALMLTSVLPFSASATTEDNQATSSNLYQEGAVEVVEIEGIEYQFSYYYEGNTRVIEVSNNLNSTVETVKYDEQTGCLYINNTYAGSTETTEDNVMAASSGTNGWETMTISYHKITYGEGVTVGAVAAAITVALPLLGAAGVIAAMGSGTLSYIAGCSIGGTVYVNSQWYSAPPAMPQYRYVWSFTASTGDYYGLYISHYSA